MKKQKSQPTQKKSKHKNASHKQVVTAQYVKPNEKGFIKVGDTVISVSDINKDVQLPIENDAKVKAIIKTVPNKQQKKAIILNVLDNKKSTKPLIENLIDEANVRVDFPNNIKKTAESFNNRVSLKEVSRRKSLTEIPFCTIDGETAKDFDDAVFAQKKGKNIEVMVAIADVSHYVKSGSPLDKEALKRGTSIYYPGACIPMLPEELSNGLCSLRPNVIRLVIVVSFELGPKGGIFRPRIFESAIKSKARLTYGEVQDFFDDKKTKKTIRGDIKKSLSQLKAASHILRKSRSRRGAIDFDITESVVALDDNGEVTTIHPQDRLDTHKMIEDLMVAANEIVADYFDERELPTLYRVHEAPDPEKLEAFFKTAHAFGALKGAIKTKAASITEPKNLQDIIKHYENSKYKETLNVLLLRAMKQARYSEKNLMHFGLASTAYLHFTSPIRRYADLMVHRQLRLILFEKNHKKKIPNHAMRSVADSISEKEIVATDLERKIDKIFSAIFLSHKVGEEFEAVIVACTEFGLFVRITEHHIEGLIHISKISDSHVLFQPEKMSLVATGSKKRYMVGDSIRVRLINVSVERGFIDFELVANDQNKQKKKNRKPKRFKSTQENL